MKRTGLDHPKMKMLAKRLGIPIAYANGIMERLWHFTSKYCPRGDIGRYSDDEIAMESGWEGDAGTLLSALKARGSVFLEEHDLHRLIVHHWPDHCEDSVHKQLVDKMELFADGSVPKLTKVPLSQRQEVLEGFRILQKDSEGSRRIQKDPEFSGIPEKDSEGSGRIENSTEGFRILQNSPEVRLALPSLAKPSQAEPSRAEPLPPAALIDSEPVDELVSEIAREMRDRHRKKSGLGGLELERDLCDAVATTGDRAAALRAIRDRWRIGCEREWSDRKPDMWPNLRKWVRERNYLDPEPNDASPQENVEPFDNEEIELHWQEFQRLKREGLPTAQADEQARRVIFERRRQRAKPQAAIR